MNSTVDGVPLRREFLAGLAALGAGAVLPGCQSVAPGSAAPFRIDVHHHLALLPRLARAGDAR